MPEVVVIVAVLAVYAAAVANLRAARRLRDKAAAELAEARRLAATWDEVAAECARLHAAARRFSRLWRCGAPDQAVDALLADLNGNATPEVDHETSPLAARTPGGASRLAFREPAGTREGFRAGRRGYNTGQEDGGP